MILIYINDWKIRYNPHWKQWQTSLTKDDGYPGESFQSLSEAIYFCLKG